VLTKANGDKFEGEFRNGAPYFGTYNYANGNTYAGELSEDLPNGNGILTENNDKKIGVWAKGKLFESNNTLENEIIHKISHPYLRLSNRRSADTDSTPGLDLLLSKNSS